MLSLPSQSVSPCRIVCAGEDIASWWDVISALMEEARRFYYMCFITRYRSYSLALQFHDQHAICPADTTVDLVFVKPPGAQCLPGRIPPPLQRLPYT